MTRSPRWLRGRTRRCQRRTAAAPRRRHGAVIGTGTARHCPSGTTGVLDSPNGPRCLPPACLLPLPPPPAPPPAGAQLLTADVSAAVGRSAGYVHGQCRGTAAPGQPGDLMPADRSAWACASGPGIPTPVSWVIHHRCTKPSPSLTASWQAIDPAANRAGPASITPERARCRCTKQAIPAPATVNGTCAVPGSHATHRAPGTLTPCWPGR
jgi:hypothetical protein